MPCALKGPRTPQGGEVGGDGGRLKGQRGTLDFRYFPLPQRYCIAMHSGGHPPKLEGKLDGGEGILP